MESIRQETAPESGVADPGTRQQSKPSGGKTSQRRLLRYAARRRLWDRAAKAVVSVGGLGVIGSILLIFFYLVYEVLPLFQGADIGAAQRLSAPVAESALLLEVDPAAGVMLRINGAGEASFLDLASGQVLASENLNTENLPGSSRAGLTAIARDATGSGLFAAGFDDGGVLIAGWRPGAEAGGGQPGLQYPFGRRPFPVLATGPVQALALRSGPDGIEIAAAGPDGPVALLAVSSGGGAPGLAAENLPTEVTVQRREYLLDGPPARQILLPRDSRYLLRISALDELSLIALEADGIARIIDTAMLADPPARISHVRLLAGGASLLAADDSGRVGQWFILREGAGARLQRVREFELFDGAVTALDVERSRRVFAAASAAGEVALVDATAENEYKWRESGPAAIGALALAPAGDLLLLEDESGGLASRRLDHPHAEFSLAALWRPTWYENYPEPALVWQSSAADDVEPKYSLAPLTFGTLKAAFYAMLFAAPLAVCAAVFTGYFMPPGARRQIKPLIELMEALPTVVIGFLAGLWLAPLVDANLAALILGVLLLPIAVLLASLGLARLPERFDFEIGEGWQVLALAPVLLLAGWLALLLAPGLESWLFDGSLKDWLTRRWGLDYVSRNAMIVGVAMGFAVIPAIYSIADDAIFTVPRHLSYGALAVGANRWQTLTRLIVPAAAPGIFSALLIGFGRAIGETMIVLMATGNTPIMDMNLFEGMRTLAANLAIEIPESEVGSSHYRILFLASLVLLLFTFLLNSVAELVRQRMRRKYRMI